MLDDFCEDCFFFVGSLVEMTNKRCSCRYSVLLHGEREEGRGGHWRDGDRQTYFRPTPFRHDSGLDEIPRGALGFNCLQLNGYGLPFPLAKMVTTPDKRGGVAILDKRVSDFVAVTVSTHMTEYCEGLC